MNVPSYRALFRRPFWRLLPALAGRRGKNGADLRDLMRDFTQVAQSAGLLNARTASMMEGAAQVNKTRVRDIMIPRSQMIVLDKNSDLQEVLEIIVESGHSRYPVVDEGMQVTGVLLAKDLLNCFREANGDGRDKPRAIQDFARPAVFVPESKRLSTLLDEFKKSRVHMAVVVDEYGGTAGLITIEDVVEQIVGDIADEHDTENSEHIRFHDGQWLIHGATPIDEFNRHFVANLKGEEGTIAGLVIRRLGRLPSKGDHASLHGFQFTVTRADGRRVHQLEVVPPEPSSK